MTKLREAEAAGRRWDGTQNQEQEPHTKMWGKKHGVSHDCSLLLVILRTQIAIATG